MVEVLREKGTTDTKLYPTGLQRMSASDGLPPRQPSQVGDATETTSSFMIAIWLPRRVTSRLKGSQFTKHRGNQFRDRGMNVHRSLHYSIWATRVMGRVPINTRRPDPRASRSVIPHRPSGGSIYRL